MPTFAVTPALATPLCRAHRLGQERARMSAERRWLDRGEIIDLMRDESSPYRDEVREHMRRTEESIDALRDGAQASLNTAMILTGDERFGIKGALPEIRERLAKLEASDLVKTADLAEIKAHQTVLLEGQGRIRRKINFFLKDEKGNWSYGKIVAASGATAALAQQITAHAAAVSAWIKKVIWVSGKY